MFEKFWGKGMKVSGRIATVRGGSPAPSVLLRASIRSPTSHRNNSSRIEIMDQSAHMRF